MNMYRVIIIGGASALVDRCLDNLQQFHPSLLNTPNRVMLVTADPVVRSRRTIFRLQVPGPFRFATLVNAALRLAPEYDALVLHDDTLLATREGYDELAYVAAAGFDLVEPGVLNDRSHAAVFVRAKALQWLRLDEAAPGYGCEWDDAIHQVQQRPRLVQVCHACVVHHGRGLWNEERDNQLALSRAFFEAKWADSGSSQPPPTNPLTAADAGSAPVTPELPVTAVQNQPESASQAGGGVLGRPAEPDPDWSILVLSINARNALLERLLHVLRPQVYANQPRVEMLVDVDNGEMRVGAKRQRLLEVAKGRYVSFVDDDDLVAPDFVERLLAAIQGNPDADAIGFKGRRYMDDKLTGEIIYDHKFKGWIDKKVADGFQYQRTLGHLNPVRRKLALRVGFNRVLQRSEDRLYSVGLKSLIKKTVFVDACLYDYFFRSPARRRQDGEKMNAGR